MTNRELMQQAEPVAWAEEIINDLIALYDGEMIKEHSSCEELIRLEAAITVVEAVAKKHKEKNG